MKSEADMLGVNLTVDKATANIKIHGRQTEVFKMAEVVSTQLINIEKGVLEKKEKELMALVRQWQYEEDGGHWAKFDPSINKVTNGLMLNSVYSG